MAAIGLLDIPPEIQLQIIEFAAETPKTLKALSLTSRSLRSIAQSVLFETLRIDLGKELRGSVNELLTNPQICAAIRFLELRGRVQNRRPCSNDVEQLSLIQERLPEMVGLRKVSIHQVILSEAFLDALLRTAANKPLQISLGCNIYPYGVIPTPHTPLRISHLHLTIDYPSLGFYRSMLHASAATLTGLRITTHGDGFMELADIDLHCLQDLTLMIQVKNEVSRTSAAAFLTAQRAIRKLVLRGRMGPLPPIPPNALPNLRELKASTKVVNQLVPGRPVEAIEVVCFQPEGGEYWFGEQVGQSTARVRKLRVHLLDAILDTRMVKRMVTILPFLESLWLPVFVDVSWPFCSITRTLVAHFPSGIPQCHRSPHFTQVPQAPTL